MNIMNRFIIVISVFALILVGCAPNANSVIAPEDREAVSLGMASSLNYLALIAIDQGYFSDAGLDVTVTDYTSGTKVLEGLFNGDVEVSIVGLSPLAFASFDHSEFRIFGSVSTQFDLYKIVARKDSGIQEPGDLKGKRIGTSEASSFHYFLHNFALEYGFSEDEVELVFSGAADQPAALASGDIDAISTREPYVSEAISLLGDNYVVFSEPALPSNTLSLVALESFLQEKPQVAERLLRALIRAEEFAAKDTAQAVSIVAAQLEVDEAEIQAAWDKTTSVVSIDQALLLGLENIAQWAVRQNLTEANEAPNFLNYLYLDGLDTVKSEAITIIR